QAFAPLLDCSPPRTLSACNLETVPSSQGGASGFEACPGLTCRAPSVRRNVCGVHRGRGACWARVSDPARLATARSPEAPETFGQASGGVGDPRRKRERRSSRLGGGDERGLVERRLVAPAARSVQSGVGNGVRDREEEPVRYGTQTNARWPRGIRNGPFFPPPMSGCSSFILPMSIFKPETANIIGVHLLRPALGKINVDLALAK